MKCDIVKKTGYLGGEIGIVRDLSIHVFLQRRCDLKQVKTIGFRKTVTNRLQIAEEFEKVK